MSGHSKWATIKRAKAANDAKKGAVFTKLANLITVAAKEKGGEIETNFSLRLAIDKAKAANMPKENVDRAIKRGTGELQGEQIVELIYEGIGPINSQYVIRCLTDNKNRTAAAIRQIFVKFGGSLGSVMWNFKRAGIIRISNENLVEHKAGLQILNQESSLNYADQEQGENFELGLIDLGAEDIKKENEGITIIVKIEDLQKFKKFFEDKGIKTESADIEYIAKEELKIDDSDKQEKLERFEEELDACEDVSDYYSNLNI